MGRLKAFFGPAWPRHSQQETEGVDEIKMLFLALIIFSANFQEH